LSFDQVYFVRPGGGTRPGIPSNGVGLPSGGDSRPGKNRKLGGRSQVDWRWTCGYQPLVRGHEGHRKDKAHEYLFGSIQFKCW
jgi:hypothetical protein